MLKQCGEEIGQADGEKVTLDVKSVNLWQPLNAYHYTARVQLLGNDKVVDEYNEEFGIRTVEVKDAKFLINGEPFYFKSGKHEDLYYNGRGLNEAANVLDISD